MNLKRELYEARAVNSKAIVNHCIMKRFRASSGFSGNGHKTLIFMIIWKINEKLPIIPFTKAIYKFNIRFETHAV